MENLYRYNTFEELVMGEAAPINKVRVPIFPPRATCYRKKMLLDYQVDEDWSIAEIVHYAPPIGWFDFFRASTMLLQNISQQLHGKVFYPRKENIFRAFHLTPLDQVRVVIFGQDPYPDEFNGQPTAQGLAFSVPNGKTINPSLRNIQRVIRKNYPQIQLNSGNLSNWAKQGILLLNKTLTVIPGKPGDSEMEKIWQPFTQEVIRQVLQNNPQTIFVLWGGMAKKLQVYLTNAQHVLIHCHPAAHGDQFQTCDHFREINQILQERNEPLIDWSM